MEEFADRGTDRADDPGRAEWMAELTAAADRLREAIGALTQALLRGSALEKADARDRFDLALAAYSAVIDETRE